MTTREDEAFATVMRALSAVRLVLEDQGYAESRALDQGQHFRVKWLWGQLAYGPLYFASKAEAQAHRDVMIQRHGEAIPESGVPTGRRALVVYLEEYDGRHNWRRVDGSVREALVRDQRDPSPPQSEEDRLVRELLRRTIGGGSP